MNRVDVPFVGTLSISWTFINGNYSGYYEYKTEKMINIFSENTRNQIIIIWDHLGP